VEAEVDLYMNSFVRGKNNKFKIKDKILKESTGTSACGKVGFVEDVPS
jgi:hypothetical protein